MLYAFPFCTKSALDGAYSYIIFKFWEKKYIYVNNNKKCFSFEKNKNRDSVIWNSISESASSISFIDSQTGKNYLSLNQRIDFSHKNI